MPIRRRLAQFHWSGPPSPSTKRLGCGLAFCDADDEGAISPRGGSRSHSAQPCALCRALRPAKQVGQSRLQASRRSKLTLPDPYDPPAQSAQPALVFAITRAITADLFLPIGRVSWATVRRAGGRGGGGREGLIRSAVCGRRVQDRCFVLLPPASPQTAVPAKTRQSYCRVLGLSDPF